MKQTVKGIAVAVSAVMVCWGWYAVLRAIHDYGSPLGIFLWALAGFVVVGLVTHRLSEGRWLWRDK